MQFRLFDVNNNQTIQDVTYIITVTRGTASSAREPLLLVFFHTKNGRHSQEVEEDVAKDKIKEISQGNNNNSAVTTKSKNKQPEISKNEMRVMKTDTALGMAFSQIIMWAIIITRSRSLRIIYSGSGCKSINLCLST